MMGENKTKGWKISKILKTNKISILENNFVASKFKTKFF
jgi:hypothetical protein